MSDVVCVAAGVLVGADGRVLLTQRRAGTHMAGCWEFPGGKCEAGETAAAALRRELREELGITASGLSPLLSLPWRFSDKTIRLAAFRVGRWKGEPASCEGQALRWQLPEQISRATLAPADVPVWHALRLPRHYLITPPDALPAGIDAAVAAALARGERLFQLRLPRAVPGMVRTVAQLLAPRCRALGASLLINHDVALARELDLGVHLRASQLDEFSTRPLPAHRWVAASCHDARQLRRARMLNADFVTLSPVNPSASHVDAKPLGRDVFTSLVGDAVMPVYALGGVGPSDSQRAVQAGAQGVAGIQAMWSNLDWVR